MVHDRPLDEVDPVDAVPDPAAAVAGVRRRAGVRVPRPRRPRPRARRAASSGSTTTATRSIAAARVLDDGDARRIGRIVTAEERRGQGLAGAARRALPRPTTRARGCSNGQAYLADWYRRFGFEVSGDEYLDDGIPHVPMRRRALTRLAVREGEVEAADGAGEDVRLDVGLGHDPQVGPPLRERLEQQRGARAGPGWRRGRSACRGRRRGGGSGDRRTSKRNGSSNTASSRLADG